MFNKIVQRFLICGALLTGAPFLASAQTVNFFKGALKENREKFYRDMTASIISDLSQPLNDETEGGWINAFGTINLLKYRTAFVQAKINFAANHLSGRSDELKKALIELLNSDYQGKYIPQVKNVFYHAGDNVLLMAISANYILPRSSAGDKTGMKKVVEQKLRVNPANTVLAELAEQLNSTHNRFPSVVSFFFPTYLPGQVLVFSFQRHNRNFPGLTIVRDGSGKFIRNADNSFFSVQQLARSESNMPGYISMGNTPQGIFRMDGFDTSKSFFIGPTTNIQLTMPFEYKASHFFRDSSKVDSVWRMEDYTNLLPENFRNYRPMYGAWYAGKAGRTEIIAHGTTIDPAYYSGSTYYPYTPSAGCLVTKEFWNEATGMLQSSDQLLLTQAVAAAGGPSGYLIVIELNDLQKPVTLPDILSLLHEF